ncbi:MAG: ABC transporter substrate-binding protein [Beijerinckiaceae bacterium]
MTHTINRRALLAGTASLASTHAAMPAFAQGAPKDPPFFSQRVAAGQLPPLSARLPVTPLVMPVSETLGRHGGSWRMVLTGASDQQLLDRTVGYDNLVRFDPGWTKVIPHLAERYEVKDGARAFVFHLRKGHKWSDGQPFTADDIVFFSEHVAQNRDLMPSPPGWLRQKGKLATVTKIDETTVEIRFPEPNGLFLQHMASRTGRWLTFFPKHYATQFHAAFNKTNLDALLQEAKAAGWAKLFSQKVGTPAEPVAQWRNPDKPTLHAWLMKSPYSGATTRVTFERNPYYFAVDSAGLQLPYLDEVACQVVQTAELTLLKAIGGEIDFQSRRLSDSDKRPVLVQNKDRGRYDFFEGVHSHMNDAIFFLNLTTTDPVKRALYNKRDFRVGLSLALDRQEIIDAVFVGQGEPWQAAPREGTPFYDEKAAKQFTVFDLKEANARLDAAGLTRKDSDGFRQTEDGKRLSILLELAAGKSFEDMAQLMKRHLAKAGVDLTVRVLERSLYEKKRSGNELDAGMWNGEGGSFDILLDPRWYFPFNFESEFAVKWAYWYEGRSEGEEPPEIVRRQMKLYDEIRSTAEPEKQIALMREIIGIARDEFFVMGLRLPEPSFGIVKRGMRNTPKQVPISSIYPDPAPMNPQTWFFDASYRP